MTRQPNENRIHDSGAKLSPGDVKALEAQLGERLPEDYRQFLLRTNGGYHDKRCFFVPGVEDSSWYDWLNRVDRNLAGPAEESEYNTMAFQHHRMGRIIPRDAISIGRANRDDALVLFYRGPRRGQVYLRYVAELDPADRRWEANVNIGLHFVAPSFSSFLGMLQYDPEFPRGREGSGSPKAGRGGKRR